MSVIDASVKRDSLRIATREPLVNRPSERPALPARIGPRRLSRSYKFSSKLRATSCDSRAISLAHIEIQSNSLYASGIKADNHLRDERSREAYYKNIEGRAVARKRNPRC